MNEKNDTLEHFGFSFERNSVHTARTIMLKELGMLLEYVSGERTSKFEYRKAVVEDNCLLKRSGKNRDLTFRHLANLYILDDSYICFGPCVTFGIEICREAVAHCSALVPLTRYFVIVEHLYWAYPKGRL